MTKRTEAALETASTMESAARSAFKRSRSEKNRIALQSAIAAYNAALASHQASPMRRQIRKLGLLRECISLYFPVARPQMALFAAPHDFTFVCGMVA